MTKFSEVEKFCSISSRFPYKLSSFRDLFVTHRFGSEDFNCFLLVRSNSSMK